MTERALLLKALAGETVDPSPIWLMRQAGRYLPEYRATRADAGGFLDLCFSPELATEVTLQPIRRFGFDAAILFSDILVTPLALGQKVWFVEGEGPRLEPIQTEKALDALSLDGFLDRLGPVFEAIRRIKEALPPHVPLVGFAGAPWTLATYMIAGRGSSDHVTSKLFAIEHPDLFDRMIDLTTEAVTRFLVAQSEAGVDAVKLFDSWAGAAWPSLFQGAVLEPAERIVTALRAQRPGAPIIAFPRGAGPSAARYARHVKPDALALDSAIDLRWAVDQIPPEICLQGNLDPVHLRGPKDALMAELDRIRAATVGRAHILNLGHGVTPESSIDNVSLLVEHWRNR